MGWLVENVKTFEGFREKAYKDPAGVWTIGYGTTRMKGRTVCASDVITKERANLLLETDLEEYLEAVKQFDYTYQRNWNKNQIGAMTSFCYNLGKGSLKQVTKNGERDDETVAEKMLLYVNAGGVKLEGLLRRRKAEVEHFCKKD